MACVIGDGEAETGPLAASWHSNKSINPATDGAVLPILHLNGFKIANPTVLARITGDELASLLRGYGHDPLFVEGDDPTIMHQAMATALDRPPRRSVPSRRQPGPANLSAVRKACGPDDAPLADSGWPPLVRTDESPRRQNCTPRVSAPSTTRFVPVTKLAAGLTRKATALAISCGVPILPVGLRLSEVL